jgi:cytochrome c-type biogenesis protein CcmH
MQSLRPLALALLPALLAAPPSCASTTRAAAQAAAPAPVLTNAQESRAQNLEGRLKCPVCRVQSVRESTSFMALEMRSKIRELIAAGRSDDEVLQYFADRYGDYILLEPRKHGFGLSSYALPFLAVIGGAAVILLRMRRKRPKPPGERRSAQAAASPRPTGAAAPLSPAERARVDEELKRYSI